MTLHSRANTKSSKLEWQVEERGSGITLHEFRPKCDDLVIQCSGFVFRNKAHAQRMLAGSLNIHGQEIIDSLWAEALSIELSNGGSNFFAQPTHGVPHCCVSNKNHRTGLTVSLDAKMSTEATKCGF